MARNAVLGLFFAGLALLLWAAATGRLARAVLAARILDELRRPGEASWLRRATPPPLESTLTLEPDRRRYAADLYRPAGRDGLAPRAGFPLVLVPGAVEGGKDDPRVAPFARLMARAGFTVVVPDLPSLRTLRAHPDNARELAEVVGAVTRRSELARDGAVGVFGISYAGGVALLVALDPDVGRRVRFVAAVGAHADLDSVVRFLARGAVFHRGRRVEVAPDPYGRLVFLKTYEEFLVSAEDRRRLAEMAARRLNDPRAPLDDLAAGLMPEGRLIYDLFERAAPGDVPALLERLPEGMKRRIHELSPARRDFRALRARLYLAHDRHDGTIPFTESYRLRELARLRVPVRLVTLESVRHVDPQPWRKDPWGFVTRDLPEAARLLAWWYALLGERGR